MFKELIRKLDEYFSRDEIIIINQLSNELELLKTDLEEVTLANEIYTDIVSDLQEKLNTYHDKIKMLEASKDKPVFNLVEDSVKYRMRPDWNDYLHKSLASFSKDTEYVKAYQGFLSNLNISKKSSVDKQVYEIVTKVYAWLDEFKDDYNTDRESFGSNEYWLSPQEAYEHYFINGDAGDCEDFSSFLWGCIVSGLKLYDYSFEGRLFRLDMIRPIGHAILVWKNDDGLFKRIESTYYREDFKKKWIDDSCVFRSVLLVPWHLFDENTEYRV